MDIFKSPASTIMLLLKTRAIPYLILNYARDSIQVLMYRHKMFMMCEAVFENKDNTGNIALKILPVEEINCDVLIRQATRITWDNTVITEEMFNDLMEAVSHAEDILRSRMIEINNKKGTGFQPSDFETLSRLATKYRLDTESWEL